MSVLYSFQLEALAGERVGLDIVARVPSVGLDALIGERVGRDVTADVPNVGTETLVGDRVGRDVVADVGNTWVEVLIKLPPVVIDTVSVDVLASLPDDPVAPKHQVYIEKEQVTQERDPLPHPADVWSWTSVYGAVQQALRQADESGWPRSVVEAGQVRAQVLLQRQPGIYFSGISAKSLVRQVLLSRGDVYVPTSGVYVGGFRLQAALQRIVRPAPQMWSNLDLGGLAHLVLMSRQAAPAQPTDEYVGQVVLQVLQATARAEPYSSNEVGQVVLQVLQGKEMDRPTDQSVAKVDQLILTAKEMPEPRSEIDVAKADLQVLQLREPEPYIGYEHVAGVAQLIALTRYTEPAGSMGAWHVGAQRVTYTMQRIATAPGDVRHFEVKQLRVAYIMARTVVPPGEVIDPSVGRHVYSLVQQMTTARDTVTPEEKMRQQRTVHQVGQHIAARDTAFQPPPTEVQDSEGSVLQVAQDVLLREQGFEWLPVSVVTVARMEQLVLCVDPDEWPDPTMAASDDLVLQVGQQAMSADSEFPGGQVPQSAADVLQVLQMLGAADTEFPDGHLPQALLDVLQVAQVAVSQDATFPTGDTPLSSADVLMMALMAMARDNALVGNLPSSPASVLSVSESVMLRDPTLVGIPSRPRGPRPSVTLTRH